MLDFVALAISFDSFGLIQQQLEMNYICLSIG